MSARTRLMSVMLAGLFAGFAGFAGQPAQFALAAEAPRASKMHRTHVGEPDASGQVNAESTDGGFAVRLPARFNDFTIAQSDPTSLVLRTDTIGGVTQQAIKFSANRITYRDGIDAARSLFARMESGQDLGGKPERLFRHRIGRYPALDFMIASASNRAYQRVVLLESDLLLMVVESPRDHVMLAERLATPFFDSLAISRP